MSDLERLRRVQADNAVRDPRHTRNQTRDRPMTDRGEQAQQRLREYIERVVAEAPPLTPSQVDRLASLLRDRPQPVKKRGGTSKARPVVYVIEAEGDEFSALRMVTRKKAER